MNDWDSTNISIKKKYGHLQEEMRKLHEAGRGLLSALEIAEKEFGYVPADCIVLAAEIFQVSEAMILGVIRNTERFHERPKAEYRIHICNGAVCKNMMPRRLMEECLHVLGIEYNADSIPEYVLSPDGRFEIELVGCIGACGRGPVITINDELFTEITTTKLKEMLLQRL